MIHGFLGVPVLVLAALALPSQDLGSKALDVFERRCAECHGKKADQTKKSYRLVSSIDDLVRLRANLRANNEPYKKKIVDTSSPADSEILKQAVGVDAEMPQDDQGTYVPLPDSEQQTLRAWFAAGMPLPGEAEAGTKPARVRPPFVDEEVWIRAILQDLDGLGKADQVQARYFTMGHLYNDGAGETGLAAQRLGLTKLLYSLSWAPETRPLKLLGTGNAIARILLRDLDWDAAKWDRILAVPNNYFVRHGLDEEGLIEQRTGTPVAYVRSDWFVFHAAQPPLYHELLAPRKDLHALDSDQSLEAYLGVDVARNVAEGQVARAGFYGGQIGGGSGVSDNNRMIERHALGHWQGAYWKSYDFGGNAGEKSIFERPFGPAALPHWSEETRKRSFVQDGGELIWNLPNGFQGYLLVDAAGKRIDQGPPQIVKDRGESGGLGTNIVNGISCMACHAQGMRRQTDKIREHVESLTPTTFTRGERQIAQKLFPTPEQMAVVFDGDERRFATAAKKVGVYDLDARQREPVLAVFQGFRDETVKFDQAAFELGLSPQQLQGQLGGALASLRRQLETQGVPRDQFLDSFRTVAKALRIQLVSAGGGRPPGPEVPATVSAPSGCRPAAGAKVVDGVLSRIEHEASGIVLVYVPPGEFMMGSLEGETGRANDERQDRRQIREGFYLGETEVTQAQWQKVMSNNPSRFSGVNKPVEQVSWEDLQPFLQRTGLRLPSEAEWEYACRAGTTTPFSFGATLSTDQANYDGKYTYGAGSKGSYRQATVDVGTLGRNAWGFADMHGNVWEWCQDVYADYPASGDQRANEQGGALLADVALDLRVLRGGSWSIGPGLCRSAFRFRLGPAARYGTDGFRAARTLR